MVNLKREKTNGFSFSDTCKLGYLARWMAVKATMHTCACVLDHCSPFQNGCLLLIISLSVAFGQTFFTKVFESSKSFINFWLFFRVLSTLPFYLVDLISKQRFRPILAHPTAYHLPSLSLSLIIFCVQSRCVSAVSCLWQQISSPTTPVCNRFLLFRLFFLQIHKSFWYFWATFVHICVQTLSMAFKQKISRCVECCSHHFLSTFSFLLDQSFAHTHKDPSAKHSPLHTPGQAIWQPFWLQSYPPMNAHDLNRTVRTTCSVFCWLSCRDSNVRFCMKWSN